DASAWPPVTSRAGGRHGTISQHPAVVVAPISTRTRKPTDGPQAALIRSYQAPPSQLASVALKLETAMSEANTVPAARGGQARAASSSRISVAGIDGN